MDAVIMGMVGILLITVVFFYLSLLAGLLYWMYCFVKDHFFRG